MPTDWNIQARGRSCTACGRSYSHQEHYHTLLYEERGQLLRSDVCQSCWEKQFSEGGKERKGFVSYWQGVFEAPPPPAEPIKKETAESLLRNLIELNDPELMPVGYILAVMLERKRLLKVKEELVRDGKRIFIYEHPKTGDVFTITDPNLQLKQLETVQRDVAALLEHGMDALRKRHGESALGVGSAGDKPLPQGGADENAGSADPAVGAAVAPSSST